MADRTCSINGCHGKHVARGWCSKHYARWRATGDPLAVKRERKPTHATPALRAAARRASKTRWRLANPEKMSAARAVWEAANPETRRGYRRARKKMDPVSNRAYVQARRARMRAATVIPFTAEQLRQRFAFYGGLCWMCGRYGSNIDHVKPIAKGGAHALCNLRPACSECNSRKGAKWPYPSSSRGARADRSAVAAGLS